MVPMASSFISDSHTEIISSQVREGDAANDPFEAVACKSLKCLESILGRPRMFDLQPSQTAASLDLPLAIQAWLHRCVPFFSDLISTMLLDLCCDCSNQSSIQTKAACI